MKKDLKEDKILEMLKKDGEALEIPESIRPEKIEEKLKKKKTRKISYGKIFGGLTSIAAACMVVGIFGRQLVLENHRSVEPEHGVQEMMLEDIPQASKRAAALSEDSYEKVFETIAEVQAETKYHATQYSMEDGIRKEMAPEEDGYSTTNTRTAGIDEADLLKTDGEYLYALFFNQESGKSSLEILEADGLLRVGQIQDIENAVEFYLLEKTLIVMTNEQASDIGVLPLEESRNAHNSIHSQEENAETKILIYDISNCQTPKLLSCLTQSGGYETSRLKDGVLYTFSRFYAWAERLEDKESYIPAVQGQLISEDGIWMPKRVTDTSYLVMTAIRLEEPYEFSDEKALLSPGQTYYVSEKHLYILAASYSAENEHSTKITRYAYENGKMEERGERNLPGSVDDSFSIDEEKGVLRVLTTDRGSRDGVEVNALYVLDENLKTVGKIEDIAKGESIYSARFLGDMAYFVTYKETDPLFTVDLSQPEDPRILGELKVTGVSEYLHFYGENRLLGIGRETDPQSGENLGVKLSMFDISDAANVTEEAKTVISGSYYSEAFYDYKSVLINPAQNIIGFLAEEDYLVYSYEENAGFVKRLEIDKAALTNQKEWQRVQGVFIDNTLYILKSRQGIEAYDLDNNKIKRKWKRG